MNCSCPNCWPQPQAADVLRQQEFERSLKQMESAIQAAVGQVYYGEPKPELTAAIWAEAERRHPDPTQQSIFNDACHWLIQRVKAAQAEMKRLHEMDERMRPWTDKEAFLKFNAKLSEAYKAAKGALAEIVGDDAIETLWYVAPDANNEPNLHEVDES